MARGKFLSLEEARRLGRLDQFAREHPSEGDLDAFDALLDRMVKGGPPTSGKAARQRRADAGSKRKRPPGGGTSGVEPDAD